MGRFRQRLYIRGTANQGVRHNAGKESRYGRRKEAKVCHEAPSSCTDRNEENILRELYRGT